LKTQSKCHPNWPLSDDVFHPPALAENPGKPPMSLSQLSGVMMPGSRLVLLIPPYNYT